MRAAAIAAIAGFAAALAACGDETNAAAVATHSSGSLEFAGCRAEPVGVYSQAVLRVAVLSGLAGRRATVAGAAVPEPDVDRSRRAGGGTPMAALPAPAPAPVQPLSEAVGADGVTGRTAARESPFSRGARGLAPDRGRWGWLAESVHRNQERQGAERARSESVFPRGGNPFSSDSSVLFGGRLDVSPLLPGDTLTPTAPMAPSPYRSEAFSDGIAP